MLRKLFVISLLFCLLQLYPLSGPGHAAAQVSGSPQTEQLLVYKNGNLQRGRIERQLGGYLALTPSGSRIVIPLEQVDFVCGSLAEALEVKRKRLPPIDSNAKDRPNARIELFQWCLKHGLHTEAEQELTQLQLSRLTAQELYGLLRQLHTAIERTTAKSAPKPAGSLPDNRVTHNSMPDNSVAETAPAKPEFMFSELPTNNPDAAMPPPSAIVEQPTVVPLKGEVIKPVAYEEATPVAAAGTLPVYELEETIKQLPVEGVSLFKRRVEPMLFKNCSNAGCHDPDKTRLPLQRLARGDGIPKRMSQQNLIQVLRFVGGGTEENAPLLLAASTAHGGGVAPPLKKDTDQYRLLAIWVERMAPKTEFAGIPQTTSTLFPSVEAPPQDLPPVDAQPLPATRPTVPASLFPANEPKASTAPLPTIPSLDGSTEKFVPADPFDPAIFNRRSKARSAASPPAVDSDR
jgi:hypothetical protein